jgi:hypothetical protein
MRITAVSHAVLVAVLVVASGVAAVTVGIAGTKNDRDAARRRCMALSRTPPAAHPSLATAMRQSANYHYCMEQLGFGRGHGKTK